MLTMQSGHFIRKVPGMIWRRCRSVQLGGYVQSGTKQIIAYEECYSDFHWATVHQRQLLLTCWQAYKTSTVYALTFYQVS